MESYTNQTEWQIISAALQGLRVSFRCRLQMTAAAVTRVASGAKCLK